MDAKDRRIVDLTIELLNTTTRSGNSYRHNLMHDSVVACLDKFLDDIGYSLKYETNKWVYSSKTMKN